MIYIITYMEYIEGERIAPLLYYLLLYLQEKKVYRVTLSRPI